MGIISTFCLAMFQVWLHIQYIVRHVIIVITMGCVVMQHVPHEFCGYHMLSPLSYYTILSLPELPIITFSTSFFI